MTTGSGAPLPHALQGRFEEMWRRLYENTRAIMEDAMEAKFRAVVGDDGVLAPGSVPYDATLPSDVSSGAASHGTSLYPAPIDHVHHSASAALSVATVIGAIVVNGDTSFPEIVWDGGAIVWDE